LPPFAIVNHRGRSSGRGYRTPVMAFPTDERFVFALTYGRDVDWVKNLFASDGGSRGYKSEEIDVHNVRHVKIDDIEDVIPLWVRLPLGIISVKHYVTVERGAAQRV
jgi:deazaflavin-dependent oxidoreductase (nitroreductase family)